MGEGTSVTGYSRLAVRVTGALAFLVTAAFAWWATMLVLVVGSLTSGELHPRPFDARLWNDPAWRTSISTESHFHSIRQRMVDDLLAQHLRPGLSKDDVLGLLGPRDEKPSLRVPEREAWIYVLGAQRGIPVDDEWLVITFDGQERVSAVSLRVD